MVEDDEAEDEVFVRGWEWFAQRPLSRFKLLTEDTFSDSEFDSGFEEVESDLVN